MIKQCRKQGTPEPEFITMRNVEFRAILPRDIFTESTLTNMGLNERQLKAVKLVKEKGDITNKEYQEICNTSERTSTRDLASLVFKDIFEQVGRTGKGTKYILRRRKDAKREKGAPQRKFRKMFKVTNKTASTDLNMFIKAGMIQTKGRGRSVEYLAK